MRVLFLFLFITFNILIVNAAKLLVFGVSNSKSHMISNGRIADALAEAGHDVTFLSIEGIIPTKSFPTTKLAKVVIIGRIPEDRIVSMKSYRAIVVQSAFKKPGIFDGSFDFSAWVKGTSHLMEQTLKESEAEIEKLKSEKFDAIFYEQIFPHGASFGHLLGINIHFLINSSPLQGHITSLFGIPDPTGWVPAVGALAVSDKMTFFERVQNEIEHYFRTSGYSMLFSSANEVFQKLYGPSFPDVKEIIKEKVPMMFVAVDELIEFPRPIFHNVVYIGGLGMKMAKNESLQAPFDAEIAKGNKGIVYFSLGSNCDSTFLPEIVKKNLLDAFSSFPDYHFIVKLEATDNYGIEYAKTKPNIFVTNWAPQALLLKHPRLKLFITHAGYNSLLEVANSGIPVLAIPIMYDQTRNGQVVERNGWGKVLDKMTLLDGKEALVELLEEMLNNEKYHKNAQRIQKLLKTKPFSANDIFIKNVNFVLQDDGKLPELKPASIDLNFMTQNNLDIFAVFFITFLLLIVFLIFYCIKLFQFYFFKKSSKKNN